MALDRNYLVFLKKGPCCTTESRPELAWLQEGQQAQLACLRGRGYLTLAGGGGGQ